MFGLKPKTVHYWYKEELSDYRRDISEGKWGTKSIKVVDKDTGEVIKEKPVPIAKPENMGSHMTIDEKQIGKKMYTIMTNSQTSKIAFLAQSLKEEELKQAIQNCIIIQVFGDRKIDSGTIMSNLENFYCFIVFITLKM